MLEPRGPWMRDPPSLLTGAPLITPNIVNSSLLSGQSPYTIQPSYGTIANGYGTLKELFLLRVRLQMSLTTFIGDGSAFSVL